MAKRVGGCTRHRDGWVRWYRGKTRFVCGLATPEIEIEDRWIALKKRIDAAIGDEHRRAVAGELTLRELADLFFRALEHRVATGKPKPLSARMLHNYTVDVNDFGAVVGGGVRVGDIGPEHFARYARTISHLKASGYASKVAHITTLFRWAVAMEYMPRARFGAEFARPAKRKIRDERIARRFAFTAGDVARLIDAATGPLRTIIQLAAAAAMTNSEIAWLERDCVDFEAGLIDFRRRKSGKIRRVIPLPADVLDELRRYRRPDPAEPVLADLFFLTEEGNAYVRMRDSGQANTLTVLFKRLAEEIGVKRPDDGRGFKSLRTTWTNLAPAGFRDEIELITGHAHGTILLDHYLEDVGTDRLRHVVDHVWAQIKTARADEAGQPGDDSARAGSD